MIYYNYDLQDCHSVIHYVLWQLIFSYVHRTSTDRYANVDVGVLLYHIERFPGIIILTTNLIDNLDKAFFRRLRFVLAFDIPSYKLRAQMWKVQMYACVNVDTIRLTES